MSSITINGISIDPEAHGPALAAANAVAEDASQSDYILIQTAGPLTQDQKATLAGLSATLLEYVPENTYVCYYPSSDLQAIRDLPFVTWANVYMQGFKVAAELRPEEPSHGAGAALLMGVAAVQPQVFQDPVWVDIVLHQNEVVQNVRRQIAEAAHVDPDFLQVEEGSGKIRLKIYPRYLDAVAQIDAVRHIEPVAGRKLHNNIARQILRAGIPLSGTTLEGEGEVVTVCDTGLDKGSLADVHPAFQGRVQKLYALGRTVADDPHGHGTHVAGSVLGDGNSPTEGGAIRGTAPKATLVLQSVLDSMGGLGGIPDDLRNLFQDPYANQTARVHTNSWGDTGNFGRYTSNAREVDDFVWNHRDLVVCFAAGNEGVDSNLDGVIDRGSITPPATAKNCITVGATENLRPAITRTYEPFGFSSNPFRSDRVANNAEGMAAFSSRGPTRDGRIKPDVVAPGTSILSTRSRKAQASTIFGISQDSAFMFDGGTSMATPLVAGCVTVIREWLRKQQGVATPSAALVKALLINGAQDIVGQYVPSEASGIPNFVEGFGRVNLASTIGPLGANETVRFQDEADALDTDEEKNLSLAIPGTASLLKVTLVWSDPPGEALQNDLDLIVRAADGSERHGNMPASSSDFDRINNVEQIFWTDIPAGPAEITVRAHRIALHAQPFALVVRIA
jgi:serine protease AprX